jgi:hypothetical protein
VQSEPAQSSIKADTALVIDRSLKYRNAAFVRVQRNHGGGVAFLEVASKLLEDELAALRLLGISSVR